MQRLKSVLQMLPFLLYHGVMTLSNEKIIAVSASYGDAVRYDVRRKRKRNILCLCVDNEHEIWYNTASERKVRWGMKFPECSGYCVIG